MTPILLLDTAEQALGFTALIIAVVSGMVAGVVALRGSGTWVGDETLDCEVSWLTDDAWPTTLGSAA